MVGKPQKNLAYSVLLDFYGPVLTDKQRVILTEYYDEDLSLAEIAENYGISRQGVRDVIVRAEAAMTEIEDKPHLIRRFFRMQDELTAIDAAADRLLDAVRQGCLSDDLVEECANTVKENTAKLKQE